MCVCVMRYALVSGCTNTHFSNPPNCTYCTCVCVCVCVCADVCARYICAASPLVSLARARARAYVRATPQLNHY